MMTTIERELHSYVDNRSGRLVELTQELVRRPSENRAPNGSELACQEYIAGVLRSCRFVCSLYTPDEAPGITSHPIYWGGRDYRNRPNVTGRRKTAGRGRSLVLSGHADTVPAGSSPWTRDPFGGDVDGNRLYGRGANDMKAGIATNLFVAEALRDLDIELAGDLTIESVVDEEFGGVNGTLAARLMGFSADAAVISEPSSLRICNAQRGGRTAHLTFSAENHGILSGAAPSVVEQLRCLLNAVPKFARMRRELAPRHPLYQHLADPVPVTVTRISTAPWGTSEPTNTPSCCRVELFWQTMPGEIVQEIDAQFFDWLEDMISSEPDVFAASPKVEFPIRWLPGSAIESSEPVVAELRSCARAVLDADPPVQGIEGPCDMYVFHAFGIPAVLWGASGGNTHNPDEYVNIDSLRQAAKVLLSFVCRWCGTQH